MKHNAVSRQVARTVLLVGEGDAEVQFMQHLKGMYVQRGSGVVVTIKNARGKGASCCGFRVPPVTQRGI